MCGIFAYIGQNIPNNIDDFLNSIKYRGPDKTKIFISNDHFYNMYLGFHRLSINDLSNNGLQPMSYVYDASCKLICNGEIYNFQKLKDENDFNFKSKSDCEIILHMYKKYGIEYTIKNLDGVFAFVLYDNDKIYVGRDIIGVRPLFIGYNINNNDVVIASEAKAIVNLCTRISQFTPGHYVVIDMNSELEMRSYSYHSWFIKQNNELTEELIIHNIHDNLVKAVQKRLMSDRPLGCFLSGGLDSSVICAIMKRFLKTPVTTFSIGMSDSNAPDLHFSKIVSDYLGTKHHNVTYTFEEGFNAIPELIYTLETFDITTIRASLPQYLLSKYIKKNTNITVLLSGEGPDEHYGGYQYLQKAPDDEALQQELLKLTTNLHYFDVLRTDRTTAKFSLEVRVPFLDKQFVMDSLKIPAKYKRSGERIEKYLIRKAFDTPENPYLPKEILWRRKNAFSDAVGYQWVDRLQEKINTLITDKEFDNCPQKYKHCTPVSKEALYYRKIFESYYPDKAKLIPNYWMPNSEWFDKKINDPSATKLDCFKSGDQLKLMENLKLRATARI
tara:strand:- start:2913 stop:4580 length:1668 start_codon:yes stop_codon:yes gene_type:complete